MQEDEPKYPFLKQEVSKCQFLKQETPKCNSSKQEVQSVINPKIYYNKGRKKIMTQWKKKRQIWKFQDLGKRRRKSEKKKKKEEVGGTKRKTNGDEERIEDDAK